MNKYILGSVLALGLISPMLTHAQTQGDVDPNGSQSACVTLQYNMTVGSRDSSTGGDVSKLQDFLQSREYLSTNPTGYFGQMTRAAVARFQSASGVLASGYVGPITRAKIKDVSCSDISIELPPITITPPICPTGALYNYMTGKPCSLYTVPPLPACTDDVKTCPDGSTVSRGGPYCTFAECPTSASDNLFLTFSGTPTAGAAPLAVNFTSNRAGTLSFGDGTQGSMYGAPTCATCAITYKQYHTYASAGTYTATLQVPDRSSGCVQGADGVAYGCTKTIGSVTITVTPSGTTQTPTISFISPNQGSANTPVTIYGTNLSGTSEVEFYNSTGLKMAGVGAPTITSITPTRVTFTISGIFAANVTPGTYMVGVVTNACPGGCSSSRVSYTLNAPTTSGPTISSFTATPPSITAGQSSILTLITTNATSCTVSNVDWSSGSPNAATPVRPTQTTTYTATCTGPGGTGTASATVTVTAAQVSAPTISSLSPSTGLIGTVVMVNGTGFTSSNTVSMNGISIGTQSSGGSSISFTVPSVLTPPCNPNLGRMCPVGTEVTPGIYNITVSNANGTSNLMQFTVTSSGWTSLQSGTVLGASSFNYTWNQDLQIGSPYLADVTALQIALTHEGFFSGTVTGGFYNETFAGVQAFQAKYGINATGYVGPITRAKLNALY